ncbi:unnamed protein product, partial [Mesorhabditis spiculigera]
MPSSILRIGCGTGGVGCCRLSHVRSSFCSTYSYSCWGAVPIFCANATRCSIGLESDSKPNKKSYCHTEQKMPVANVNKLILRH